MLLTGLSLKGAGADVLVHAEEVGILNLYGVHLLGEIGTTQVGVSGPRNSDLRSPNFTE